MKLRPTFTPKQSRKVLAFLTKRRINRYGLSLPWTPVCVKDGRGMPCDACEAFKKFRLPRVK